MYKFKVDEKVWCNIGRSRGGDLPWRRGYVLRRHTRSTGEIIYNTYCRGTGFEVSEKDVISVESVELGITNQPD